MNRSHYVGFVKVSEILLYCGIPRFVWIWVVPVFPCWVYIFEWIIQNIRIPIQVLRGEEKSLAIEAIGLGLTGLLGIQIW